MPEQFLMRYDFELLWALRDTLIRYRKIARNTKNIIAHSVIDELVLYIIIEKSRFLMEDIESDIDLDDENDEYIGWDEWIFEIFDDMDIVTFLYTDSYLLTPNDSYHFDNWLKQQFYT